MSSILAIMESINLIGSIKHRPFSPVISNWLVLFESEASEFVIKTKEETNPLGISDDHYSFAFNLFGAILRLKYLSI